MISIHSNHSGLTQTYFAVQSKRRLLTVCKYFLAVDLDLVDQEIHRPLRLERSEVAQAGH
jgi:hypothetical protein